MKEVVFPSRVDAWLVVLVIAVAVLLVLHAVEVYPISPAASVVDLGVLAFLLLLGGLIGYPCTYTLTQTHLVIRFGVCRHQVAYGDITGVQPSRSLWSAPALSLRRVKIRQAGRFHLVSPHDREQFITLLQQRVAAARTQALPAAGGAS